MALKPLFGFREPIGIWDALDSEVSSFKGGEVVTLTTTAWQGSDKAASDQYNDGYSGTTSKVRPVVTLTLTSGNRPLFLSDDGISGYGTLFGTVIGGTTGQIVSGGTVLGPTSALGSGKVTCWRAEGTYAVTLDAVDTTASTGLVPGNSSLAAGTALYATTAGKLTPASGSSFESNLVVARFIEFTTGGSLVTSTAHLVSAINSPTSDVAGATPRTFVDAVVNFNIED